MDPETEMSIVQLKVITNDFSNEIGSGSFGVVYEGKLPDGKPVAVKKLKDSTAHDKEFRKEVEILTKVNHENIVKLIGYCCSKQDTNGRFGSPNVAEKFLCFEHASKGSLNKHVYGEPSKLGWPIRFQIIKGICRGLQALHEQENPIVHSDLNPSNILLDDNMKPKIADFGLSKLFGAEQTHTHRSTSRSAIQYMSPEYLQGSLSIKSDIYSLGLLILVTTTGEEIRCDAPDFIRKVRRVWTEKHIESKYVAIGAEGIRQVKGCIGVGLRCVETKQDKRPSSQEVVRMVEGSGESSLLSKLESPRRCDPTCTVTFCLADDSSENLLKVFRRG